LSANIAWLNGSLIHAKPSIEIKRNDRGITSTVGESGLVGTVVPGWR